VPAARLMGRPANGSVSANVLADGTRAFHLRFRTDERRVRVVLHEAHGCDCGCGGGWDHRAARSELSNLRARVRAGIWRPETPGKHREQLRVRVPTFGAYADRWLQAKIDGALGDHPIAESTASDYRWRLRMHLLPYFGHLSLAAIDRRMCQEFKAYKLRQSVETREALDAGVDLRDHRNRRLVPLGPASLYKVIAGLAAILEDAVEDEHIDANPARGKRMRVRVPKPNRTFLEMDELAELLDCAEHADLPLRGSESGELAHTRTQAQALVAHCLMRGIEGPTAIAAELGLAKSTVSYHLNRINGGLGRGYAGRRVVCEILGRCGLRVSELCDVKIGQVRLHDPDGARLRIVDAKTAAGVREVQMTPHLTEVVAEHLDRLRRIGHPTGPSDYLVPNITGGRISRQRVGQIVVAAAQDATAQLGRRGVAPLPNVTPHTLRRTYISIALLANNFDVKWVMSQVGHADSKMTMDVYAQLEQRVDRSHGINFDNLLRKARHRPEAEAAASAQSALALC
jgi:integrase